MPYNTFRCRAIWYGTIRYDTMEYDAIWYNTIRYMIPCDTMWYDAMRYDAIHDVAHNNDDIKIQQFSSTESYTDRQFYDDKTGNLTEKHKMHYITYMNKKVACPIDVIKAEVGPDFRCESGWQTSFHGRPSLSSCQLLLLLINFCSHYPHSCHKRHREVTGSSDASEPNWQGNLFTALYYFILNIDIY